jgi:hypothetical protein
MNYKNVTKKSIILYQPNGIKHVIPPGGIVDGLKFPEISSSYDFEFVEDVPIPLAPPIKEDFLVTEVGKLKGDFIIFKSEFLNTIALLNQQVENLILTVTELVSKTSILDTAHNIKTEREPKKSKK